jgi:asparagine N-glycosylation enzyme membrane subunit Stt3
LLFSAALATWRCFKSGKKPSKEAVLFLFISVMMFIMYLSARRFAEYYAPAAVFTAALFLKDSIKADSHKILISLSLLSLILFSAIRNSEVVPEAAKLNPNKYQTVFDYLSNFARQDDVVFNPGWADFPFFIWQSYDYRYINGLDPHYLAYGDWNRFTRWWAFYNDSPATLEDPVSVIRNEFNADWIALDGTYPNLLMFLLQSERVQLVVADEQQFLFKVLPERGNSDQ